MKLYQLIEKLQAYNQMAEVYAVVDNKIQPFTLAYGYSEGCIPETCDSVLFNIGGNSES